MDTSNIIFARIRKAKGTVYNQLGISLLRHRDVTQLDEDEEMVHADDRQGHDSGMKDKDNMSTGTNKENNEDDEEGEVKEEEEEEEEEEMQNENETSFCTDNISTTDGNEVNNNNRGTNNNTIIDEVTTVTSSSRAHTLWGKARLEVEIAKNLKEVNAVLTNSAVEDIKR